MEQIKVSEYPDTASSKVHKLELSGSQQMYSLPLLKVRVQYQGLGWRRDWPFPGLLEGCLSCLSQVGTTGVENVSVHFFFLPLRALLASLSVVCLL